MTLASTRTTAEQLLTACEALARKAYAWERTLESAGTGAWTRVAVRLPMPADALIPRQMLDAAVEAFSWVSLWEAPRQGEWLALGQVVSLRAEGVERTEVVRSRAEQLFDRLVADGEEAPRPRLFGGLAFEAGGGGCAPWQAFGDIDFALPRFLITSTEEGCWLQCVVGRPEVSVPRAMRPDIGNEGLEGDLERLRRMLHGGVGTERSAAPTRRAPTAHSEHALATDTFEMLVRADALDTVEAWRRRIGDLLRAIEIGEVEKVVAARRLTEIWPGAVPFSEIVDRLALQAPGCTRFAFFRDGALFAGASPERLVALSGRRVATQALAGSLGLENRVNGPAREREIDDGAAWLLASTKERREHESVVRHMRAVLEPLCVRFECPTVPGVQVLRHLIHLETPISGVLRADQHVLSLVAALHPTPAVAGAPVAEALRWIARQEPEGRGWYASPVGWFDQQGGGELCVALRSMLLEGGKVHLFAGAGIVEGSDPDAELLETTWKLASARAVLDLEAAPRAAPRVERSERGGLERAEAG